MKKVWRGPRASSVGGFHIRTDWDLGYFVGDDSYINILVFCRMWYTCGDIVDRKTVIHDI